MHIVVLSRNSKLYSTSRLVETIEESGHEATVLDHLKCDLVSEKDNPSIYYRGTKIEGVDAVIPRIGASVTFYGSAVVRQFEMMKIFTAVESQALVRSRDKLRSLQILARAGVGMPKTVFTNYSSEVKKVIASVGGPPLIVKLLEGTQGVGVVLAPTQKAAESIIQAFHSMKARVIVQEFIEEAKGEDIRAFVVDGKVVGAMKRKGKDGEFRSNVHRGGSVELIKLNKQQRKAALVAARSMGLSIAGVDMLQSDRGPLILEVNSSPGLEGIERATQKDIAGQIIRFIEKKVQQQRDNKSTRRKIKSDA
ncbi:30S ribosomal protein S6--L-glutamate ligase [Balneolaceae bacterium YR4-1]|uniref:30S ribosomal protein S6--L-glutamate ligase n=1 Tax=Halalkalibaculum roseum TaxID=2709311 RepID=A0A6M1T314_9BACT|nr:30S ribosomal protein S6--L-glutamate ligase [Halalkalibaculum roseum]NGP76395.1 30S ribosomal protein S6--L-glutamate ligase [Halalkalibaculum roseum]